MVSCLNLVSETSTWNFILVMLFTRLLHIILYTQLWHVCSCIDQWNPNARSLRVELISVILYLHGRDDKRVRNGQIANVRTISSFRSIHLSRQIRPCRRKQTISRQRTRYGQCVFVTHRANSRDSLTDDAFVSLLRARARAPRDLRSRKDILHVLIRRYTRIRIGNNGRRNRATIE